MKKGWERKKLGELCRIKTCKKDVNQGNPDGKFPFFTCAAEHTFSDSYSFDTEACSSWRCFSASCRTSSKTRTNSAPDAIVDLGAAVEIKEVFVGFQKFLYVEKVA